MERDGQVSHWKKRAATELSWDDIRADAEADLTARQEKVRTQWEERLKEADALQSDSSPPAESAPAPTPAPAAESAPPPSFVWRRPASEVFAWRIPKEAEREGIDNPSGGVGRAGFSGV